MKILLIDTGFSALPIYYYLKQQSDDVWVMGNREADVIARHAEGRFIKQDYSKISDVRTIVQRMGFDYIVPGCTDVSMNSCIAVDCNSPFRDSMRTNEIINKKSLFRSICSELGMPSPQEFQKTDFPLIGKFICKPIDGFSGRGVTVFDGTDKNQLENACLIAQTASPSSAYIIENYVEGELHSCTGFIENGKLENVFFVREGSSVNPYAVDTSYVTEIPKKTSVSLISNLNRLGKHLQLKDGLLHTQFILNGDELAIIEMTRRCPGDLYSLLIEYSTGYNYAAKYASFHLGQKFDAKIDKQNLILRHTVSADENGIYDGFFGFDNVMMKAFFPLLNIGHDLESNQKSRVGLLFCNPNIGESITALFNRFMERRVYKLDLSK